MVQTAPVISLLSSQVCYSSRKVRTTFTIEMFYLTSSLDLSKFFTMLVIEDSYLTASGLSEAELKLEIAIMLFEKERLSLRKAASLANMHWLSFMKELDKRELSLHYDESLL